MAKMVRCNLRDDQSSLGSAPTKPHKPKCYRCAVQALIHALVTLSATMRRMHETDITNGGPGFLDRVSKRPAVPHGLRSTFSDWVSERTRYPAQMAVFALAHKIANAVEAAYRRGDMLEKRRQLMTDWANFLEGTETSDATIIEWVA